MEEGIRSRLERRRTAQELKALRWFGFGLGVILAVVAWSAIRRGRPWVPVPVVLAGAFWGAAALKPAALKAVYSPWMRVVGLIGHVVTGLLMAVLYYVFFTPYAVFLRLAGKVGEEQATVAGGFWVQRSRPPERESYRAQF